MPVVGPITTFDAPGSSDTTALSVNSSGVVVGYFTDAMTFASRGFIRNIDGSFIIFDYPAADNTMPVMINDAGAIVGTYTVGVNTHGFIRSVGGAFTSFDMPSQPNNTQAIGIGTDGSVTVQSTGTPAMGTHGWGLRTSGGSWSEWDSPPDAYLPGGPIGGSRPNLNGFVVGYYTSDHSIIPGFDIGWQRFADNSVVRILEPDRSGDSDTWCYDINLSGVVVGGFNTSANGIYGFLRDADGTTYHEFTVGSPLDDSNETDPFSVNDSGVCVGQWWFTSGFNSLAYGFRRNADASVDSFSISGGDRIFPMQISNRGDIAGYYYSLDDHITHGFVFEAPSAPDFSLAAAPIPLIVRQGNMGVVVVSCSPSGGFNSDVDLSLSGAVPFGTNYIFDLGTITGGSGFSNLIFDVGALSPIGDYPFIVIGTSGILQHEVAIELDVIAAASGTTQLTFPKQPSQISFVVSDPLSNWYVRVKHTDIDGEGPWATLDISQFDLIESGFLRGQGSIIPSLDNNVSALFTYTSTTTTIDISWPPFILEYADASQQFVASGSFLGTGLSPSTTYNVFPKIYCVDGSLVLFDTPSGHSAFVPVGSADLIVAANDVQADGWISLAGTALSFPVVTPGSGTGGGGGGGSGCAVEGEKVNSHRGLINVEDCYVGLMIEGADPIKKTKEWGAIAAISSSDEMCIQIELEDLSLVRVSISTVIPTSLGEKKARYLTVSDNLFSRKAFDWIKIKNITGIGSRKVVRIQMIPTHWYFVGDILTHNVSVKDS